MNFTGIQHPEEFRMVTRAHIIAWRDDLVNRSLSGMSIRHRLAALSSLFEYLCERNTVTHNPVKGVKRPAVESYEGKTPALGDHQARQLLEAPDGTTIKGKRDRAILATLLYHALRRDELCRLKIKDFKQERRGVPHLKVSGKGGKTRYVPLHPAASGLIHEYLDAAEHGLEDTGFLFRSVSNNRIQGSQKAITPDAVYKIVRAYSEKLGFKIGAHSLRATAATNALDHQADIAKVQEWLGHANIATTRIYDHRKTLPEDSPTFKVTVDEELEALPTDMKARFVWISQLIETHGLYNVREPYIKHVEDVLWEIRMKSKDEISRALYVTVKPKRVIVVRVFVKKTQKTPRREIKLALKRAQEIEQ